MVTSTFVMGFAWLNSMFLLTDWSLLGPCTGTSNKPLMNTKPTRTNRVMLNLVLKVTASSVELLHSSSGDLSAPPVSASQCSVMGSYCTENTHNTQMGKHTMWCAAHNALIWRENAVYNFTYIMYTYVCTYGSTKGSSNKIKIVQFWCRLCYGSHWHIQSSIVRTISCIFKEFHNWLIDGPCM